MYNGIPFCVSANPYASRPFPAKQTCGKPKPAANAQSPILRAELLATLRAPATQNIASVRRRHALTATMHLAALSLLRLIGTYHPITPLLSHIKDGFPSQYSEVSKPTTLLIIQNTDHRCQQIFHRAGSCVRSEAPSRSAEGRYSSGSPPRTSASSPASMTDAPLSIFFSPEESPLRLSLSESLLTT